MAARRISYISFLVLIATLATASNADGLSYCNNGHLLVHCMDEVAGQVPVCSCSNKKLHDKAPHVLQTLTAMEAPAVIGESCSSPLSGYYPDIRSEITDKNRILRE